MADRIIKKKYYKIEFKLASPLALGSGDNDNTDKDLVRDNLGKPYIPASSVAGVVREYLEADKPEAVKKYFGEVIPATKSQVASQSESLLIFYDAEIMKGDRDPIVSVRDSVALDEFKTSKKGAKFDMEVLEPGVTFRTFIEQDYTEESQEDLAAEAAKVLLSGNVVFGGKGTRGYGNISDVRVWENEFSFSKESDVESWLQFDLYSDGTKWGDGKVGTSTGKSGIVKFKLRQRCGLSIRRYTTKPSTDDKTEPDMEQLTLHNGKPVIPGTSWAGAISRRMSEFGINTREKGSIFGFVKGEGKDEKARSGIVFRESVLNGCHEKTLSRNAIDRFTGGAADSALFTEKTVYDGTTELVIEWRGLTGPEGVKTMPDKEKKALAAALTDLHFGFLAVGGETSIGRGLFEITSINGNPVPENKDDIYVDILKAIEEAFR